MNRAAPVKPEFEQDMVARNRKGMVWHVIFQASTVFGIIALDRHAPEHRQWRFWLRCL